MSSTKFFQEVQAGFVKNLWNNIKLTTLLHLMPPYWESTVLFYYLPHIQPHSSPPPTSPAKVFFLQRVVQSATSAIKVAFNVAIYRVVEAKHKRKIVSRLLPFPFWLLNLIFQPPSNVRTYSHEESIIMKNVV